MCLIIRHIRQNDTQATRLIDTRTAVITSKPILKDYNGDISKRWYIEYWLTNTTTDRQERVREWVSAKLKKELRYKFAEKRIKEIEEKYKELPKSKFDLPQNILRIQNKLVNLIDLSDLRDKSKSTYKTCVYHLCKYLKESKLTELSEIDIEIAGDFLQNMYSEYNANTVKNTLNHLKATFSEAMREKLITVNPFVGIRLKAKDEDGDFNTPFNDYEKEEIEKHLIKHNYNLYLFTRFIFYAFLRPKELRHITVGDIDLRLKTIRVKGEVSKTNSRDIIPILKPLYELIEKNKLLNYPKSYYLFGKNLTPSAEKLPANLATTLHKEVLEELEIYKERVTTLYAWKHTGNIHAYLANMDIKMIQRINRHKSIATTEIYLKKLGLFLDKTAFDFSF